MKVEDWVKELDSEDKAHKDWRDKAQKVVDRYEDEQEKGKEEATFNILWSNTEVLHSAVYEKTPTPDIRRRFLDRDPAGKKAAEVAERAVSYALDVYDFDGTVDCSIDDRLVPGLGQVRLRYEPYFDKGDAPRVDLEVRDIGLDEFYNPMFGAFNGEDEITEFEQDEQGPYIYGEPEEELVYEEVTCEPVNWKRFRWQPSARWEDVDWCSIEHFMTKDELEEQFGKEMSEAIPLGYNDSGSKTTTEDEKSRALIHEIFDKKERKIITIAEGYNEVVDEEDDPLNLEGFYPFPKPLMGTLKNGKFIPIPDYLFYQDQAIELDKITARITILTDELKYRGVYDGSFKSIIDVSNLADGEFVAIEDFQERFNGAQGDLRKIIAAMPLEEIISARAALYKDREETKQVIYEITGIADIMRGSTKSSETLGAQQLKTQFGSMRMGKRKRETDAFVRDIIRLKTEIMVENFQTETLEQMTGMEIDEEVNEILHNDLLRSYRIDIETDSTITEDAGQEKQQRIELVTAVTGFVEKVAPQVQAGIMPANVAKELLGFAVRGFKIGRTLEDTLDEMGGDQDQDPRMQQMQGQMQQQVEQIKQQAGQYVQQVQQDSQKQIQALQKQLFEKEKQLAISNEKTQVKLNETKIKADIQTKAALDKNDLTAQIEMFKAQLDAIQRIPDERTMQTEQMMSLIGQAFEQLQGENQQVFESLNSEIQNTKQDLNNVLEFVKRPAKAVKQADGTWTATRE